MSEEVKPVEIEKKTNKMKPIIFMVIPGFILIILSIALFFVINPRTKYEEANKKYDDKNYKEAINLYEDLNGYKDSKEKLNRAYFEYGLKLLQEENFGEAVGVLEKASMIGSSKYLDYARALYDMDFGKYEDAIIELTNLGDFEKAPLYLTMTYYFYGDSLIDSKKYDEAIKQFELAGDFEDSKEKIKASKLFKAEKFYKEGSLTEAKAIYKSLDKDFEYNGIKVADRLSTLKKYSKFVTLSGSWKGKKGKMVVKHVLKADGSWDSWKNTYASQLDIKCIINDDGSVKVAGSTNFFTFTNYSDDVNKVEYDNIVVPILTTIKKGKDPTTIVKKHAALTVPDKTVGYVSIKFTGDNVVLDFKLDDVNYSKKYSNVYTSTITYKKVK